MIVEIDILIDRDTQIFEGPWKFPLIQPFTLQMSEEVLAARIVVTVGLSGMGNSDPFFLEISDIRDVCVLESLIGMKKTRMGRIPFIVYDLIYSVHHQFQIVKAGDLIGYNGIVIKVLDHGKIHTAFLTVNVTHICHQLFKGSGSREVTGEEVLTDDPRFFSALFSDVSLLYLFFLTGEDNPRIFIYL